jgi:hypothetical protein
MTGTKNKYPVYELSYDRIVCASVCTALVASALSVLLLAAVGGALVSDLRGASASPASLRASVATNLIATDTGRITGAATRLAASVNRDAIRRALSHPGVARLTERFMQLIRTSHDGP